MGKTPQNMPQASDWPLSPTTSVVASDNQGKQQPPVMGIWNNSNYASNFEFPITTH